MNDDLVEKARKYAEKDEYHITKDYIMKLCDEIDRLRNLNRNVLSKIQDNKAMHDNAERYLWLRNGAWDVPPNVLAPIVVNCDNKMSQYEWLDGSILDIVIDKWRAK